MCVFLIFGGGKELVRRLGGGWHTSMLSFPNVLCRKLDWTRRRDAVIGQWLSHAPHCSSRLPRHQAKLSREFLLTSMDQNLTPTGESVETLGEQLDSLPMYRRWQPPEVRAQDGLGLLRIAIDKTKLSIQYKLSLSRILPEENVLFKYLTQYWGRVANKLRLRHNRVVRDWD